MRTPSLFSFSTGVRLGLAFLAANLANFEGQAQPSSVPLAEFWRTDGPVYAIAVKTNLVYIGGQFSYLGPDTGGAGVVDAATAAFKPGFPTVNGIVYAAAADGNGGWYIGGNFSSVGGIVRSNVAHILRGNVVDPAWDPCLNGSNLVIAVSGGSVYIGGAFTRVGATTRNRIAALDATTGQLTPWNPNATSGLVSAIVPAEGLIYVGGSFTTIGSQSRSRIAALDVSTGLATTWNPGATPGVVNAIAITGTTVYVGGSFTTAGGKPRSRIAALDTASNTALSWIPEANGTVNALAVSGSVVYSAGLFTSIGGDTRIGLAALDVVTGVALPTWNPAPNTSVNALLVSGTNVFVGGAFGSIGGQSRTLLAAVDPTEGTISPWNPGLSGLVSASAPQVYAIALSGDEVLAGGTFYSMGGVTRSNLACLDSKTGEATAWDPNARGLVSALAVGSESIYVGGTFTNIGGIARRRLAAVHPLSGAVQSFDPNVLGRSTVGIYALATDAADRLYVGGNYTNIGGASRNGIAVFESDNLLNWDPNAQAASGTASASVNTLLLDGNTLYAGGDFVNIGGQSRARIAAIDTSTGAATAWNPGASNAVYTLALAGSNLYVGGTFTNIAGQTRGRIAALSTSTGQATTWNPNAGVSSPQVRALALAGKSVYVGGQFTQIGGEFRNRLAGLNMNNGLAHDWNPNANAMARVICRTPDALYVGGDFTTIGGKTQTYLAVFAASIAFAPGSVQRQPNGEVTGTLISADGDRVSVQATSDFVSWSEITTFEPAGFPLQFTDTEASGSSKRFYRAILEND